MAEMSAPVHDPDLQRGRPHEGIVANQHNLANGVQPRSHSVDTEKYPPPSHVSNADTVETMVAPHPVHDAEKETQPNSSAGGPAFEDEGPGALRALIGAWCMSFSTFGLLNSFGTINTYLSQHQLANSPSAAIGMIGSLQYFILLVSGVLVGRLFDWGYFRHMNLAGAFLLTFSIFMLSLCKEYYQFLLSYGMVAGCGFGFLYIPSVSVLSQYYLKRRALAIGVSATGASIGGIVIPIQLHAMFDSVDYGWSIRTTGFIILAVSGMGTLLLRSRLPPKRTGPILDLSVYNSLPYSLFVAGIAFINTGLYLPIYYITSYALHIGINADLAFYSLAILNGGSLIGRSFPSWLADRIGSFVVMVPCTGMCGLLIFLMLTVHSPAQMVLFAVSYGFFTGVYVALIPACIAALTTDMHLIGYRTGMLFFIASFGSLVTGPIAGALISAGGGEYWKACTFSGITVTFGVGLCAAGGLVHHHRMKRARAVKAET